MTSPPSLEYRPALVLHAAAWTDVDGAEADPEGAARVNVEGTRNVVALGAPVVYFSTDYVFDGLKSGPYVESDEPSPVSEYGRTKLDGEREVREGWIVRSSWLFGWTGKNFVRTMLALGEQQDEVSVVDDQRGSPTYVGDLAEGIPELLDLPQGIYHLAADGRLHVGRVRRGDLRGSGPELPGPPNHQRRAGPSRDEAGELSPPQRAPERRAYPTGAKASEPA